MLFWLGLGLDKKFILYVDRVTFQRKHEKDRVHDKLMTQLITHNPREMS